MSPQTSPLDRLAQAFGAVLPTRFAHLFTVGVSTRRFPSSLLAVALALLTTIPPATAHAVSEPEYQQRLVELGSRDQALRTGLGACTSVAAADQRECGQRIREGDLRNMAELHVLLWRRGWPLASQVGHDAAFSAFLVIQHADLGVQAAALPTIAVAVWQGELRPDAFALLTDRVLIRLGRAQLFGTQSMRWQMWPASVRLPVQDPTQLAERRRALGLNPLPW